MLAKGLAWKSAALAGIIVVLMVTSVVLVVGAPTSSAGAAAASTAGSAAPSTAAPSAVNVPAYGGPHPGTLQVYEAGGPGTTEDPATAYDTVSYEPLLNVYQTLISYNGSSVANFVPQLATCVPGTAQCMSDYGSSLITYNATTGFAATYTFVIDPTANFYDPTTTNSWGVWPSDVVFSLARTMSFANLPFSGLYNGWIITQALLPHGNSGYDGGIHAPYNNTPFNILSSMYVNNTQYCPALAMSADHGCVTFNVGENGSTNWPFFLQLILDPLGSSIVPCGAFTNYGAAVPGFAGSGAASGDGPCLLPGGASSTNDSGFQTYLHTVSATAWDSFQELAAAGDYAPQPWAQWNMIGSGPYYLTSTIDSSIGYTLAANPAYAAPSGCAGQTGCEPLPGHYQSRVSVSWGTSDATGISEVNAGQADLAAIELPAHVATFNQLHSKGLINYIQFKSISVFFQPFALQFNVATAQSLSGTAGTVNVPGDFMSYIALRQFIVNAVPYLEVNQTLLQLSGGVTIGIGYGGAIPKGMNDIATGLSYYGNNISWPGDVNQNPVTDPSVVGSAAWWWAQGTNASSPYFDPELAACTSSTPCTFPLMGEVADTFHDAEILYLINEIKAISGGALQPYTFDLTFHDLIINCAAASPGTSGCPLWNLGWAPDYPDPTDYVAPMYLPDQIYTAPDAVYEALSQPQFNLPTCPYVGNWSSPSSAWQALVYYHSLAALPTGCQGVAYNVSTYWFEQAGATSAGTQRVLEYTMSNYIEYLLGLYIWNFQSNQIFSYAPWIDGSTLNTNVAVGGGGDIPWYNVGYSTNYASYNVTFTESGLPSGQQWSVSLNGGAPASSTGTTITASLPNGTFAFVVASVGYGATPTFGNVTVAGAVVTQSVAFAVLPVPDYTFVFFASFSTVGATWSVTLNGVTNSTTGNSVSFYLPNATSLDTFTWYANATGYTASPAAGNLQLGAGGTGKSVSITFTGSTGSIVLAQLPSNYNLWVNGAQVVSGGNSSTYTISGLAVGTTVSYEVQASGYNTYFNNATVAPGQTTVAVGPSLVTSPGGSSSWTSLSTLAYILIAVLAVLVVVFIVTTAMARGGKPPMAPPPESWKGSDSSTPSEPPK